jgi:hypothetical protein
MLFNIYYINFSKVYEIKMMLSNLIKTEKTVETDEQGETDAQIEAKMGAKFLKVFNAELGSNLKASTSDSQKVLETFKVTMTKSVILNEVIERSLEITDFTKIQEGTLIKLNNVRLSLENETELRTVKMFLNGSFKGLRIPEAGGLDINNVFNSMFKDYSYKLKGKIDNSDNMILIKIPLTFENEFESLYNVDDLFIGKVSILGIYKGMTKIDNLRSSFEFFQELGQSQNIENIEEVHSSQYNTPVKVVMKSEGDNKDYHYVDLLAIVQCIGTQNRE